MLVLICDFFLNVFILANDFGWKMMLYVRENWQIDCFQTLIEKIYEVFVIICDW